MKGIYIFACLSLLITFKAKAQDTNSIIPKPKTEIQKLGLKFGSIIKRQYFDLYQTGWNGNSRLKFEIINISDASTKISLWGLIANIEVSDARRNENYSVYIDEDELPSIIKFIEFLEMNDSIKPKTYTEYIYNFKDFQIWGYNDAKFKERSFNPVGVNKSIIGDEKAGPTPQGKNPKKSVVSNKTTVKPPEQKETLQEVEDGAKGWFYGIRTQRFTSSGQIGIGLDQLVELKNQLNIVWKKVRG